MAATPNPTPALSLNWPAIGVALAILVQAAAAIAFGARAQTQISELQAVTEPLRKGDLARIETDVAWIRQRLEREEQAR